VNANFETGPFGSTGTVTGWTVIGHVSDNAEGATSGTHSAALSNAGDSQGDTLSQTFSTTTGGIYTVDFDAGIFGKRTGNPFQVQVQVLGSTTLLNQTVTPPDAGTFTASAVIFQHYQFNFTADGTTATVKFISVGTGNPNADEVVDNVAISLLGQPTQGPTPTVRISAAALTVNQGTNTTVTVSASAASGPMTIPYATGGTAAEGLDYTLTGTPGQITIPAGETSASIQLNALPQMAQTTKAKTAKLTLMAGSGYKLPKKGGKSVTIKIRHGP
jgi:hypothetical protein